jgi:hypothetical protein
MTNKKTTNQTIKAVVPPIPQYNKKPPATDSRIPLDLREVVSTQFNRTAILLAFSGIIFNRKHITVPVLVHCTSYKESREGTFGEVLG